jgi:hypothetical protein
MVMNQIHSITKTLMIIKHDPEFTDSNPKLYTSKGILLENYAKHHKVAPEALKKLIVRNSFFSIGSTTIQTGLFSKRDIKTDTIKLEDIESIKEKYKKDPEKVMQDSTASPILTEIMVQIISEKQSDLEFKPKLIRSKLSFEYPQEDRFQLYKKYFPDELEKIQREGRTESNLEKKFGKRVMKGAEFHFSDGKVAHSLMTWFQSIQLAPNDIIAFHLKNNDFYHWLEESVKAPELGRICLELAKRLEANLVNEKEVKTELFKNINKTSLNNTIFDNITLPLLKKVKSNDPKQAEKAIDKLIIVGDSRAVGPMMERIFDSRPQIRHKIIRGLGKFKDKRATPTLLKILKHSKDTQDRLLAVKTLGVLGDERAINALTKIAKNKDEVGAEAKKILENQL